ncbi:MAG: hypothetical protein QOH79_383 [Acidimicrobiaceae bacterium]
MKLSEDRGGLAAAAGLALVCTVVSWLRWRNFWAGGFDVGVFDQGAYLMSKGHAPVISLLGRDLFSDHLSPVMVLFALPYRIAPTVFWLFLAQGVCLGLTVLPLRAMARDLGVDQRLATFLVVVSAPLAAAAMFDFHPNTLAVPFLAWALLGARRGDVRLTVIACIAVLVCRADLGWVLASTAIVARDRTWRPLVVLGVAGIVAGSVIPGLLGNPGTWVPYYGHLGSGPLDFALHPWRLVTQGLGRDSMATYFGWLLPVGLVVVFRPRWLLAIGIAGFPVLFSRWAGTQLPWFHYGAPFVPLVIGGALEALAPRGREVPIHRSPAVAVGGAVAAALLFGPLAPRAPDSVRLWSVVREDPTYDYASAVAAVHPHDAVSATNRALSHLMHRDHAYLFPLPFTPISGTYPAGLETPPSRSDAQDVDIVILDPKDEDAARREGFTVVTPARSLYVARR